MFVQIKNPKSTSDLKKNLTLKPHNSTCQAPPYQHRKLKVYVKNYTKIDIFIVCVNVNLFHAAMRVIATAISTTAMTATMVSSIMVLWRRNENPNSSLSSVPFKDDIK
jgi:hypothetical protein